MRKPKPLDPIRFNCAVRTLALLGAKTKVIAQLRADGKKVCHYSSAEITQLAEAYFAAHCSELIPKAVDDAWRMPMFARYRQPQTQPSAQPGG